MLTVPATKKMIDIISHACHDFIQGLTLEAIDRSIA